MVRVVDCHTGVLGSNPGGPRYFPLGITSAGTIPRTTLYNITSLVSRRLCCKIGNLRSSNIDVTHPSNLDL